MELLVEKADGWVRQAAFPLLDQPTQVIRDPME
jgi:hypothetical protein